MSFIENVQLIANYIRGENENIYEDINESVQLAHDWANAPVGVEPDPTLPGEFSAFANAQSIKTMTTSSSNLPHGSPTEVVWTDGTAMAPGNMHFALEAGVDGIPGEKWLVLNRNPNLSEGIPGDLALNKVTSNYFEKRYINDDPTQGAQWYYSGNLSGKDGEDGMGIQPKGQITVAELNALDESTMVGGDVWIMTDAGTITDGEDNQPFDVLAHDWVGRGTEILPDGTAYWMNLGHLEGPVGPIGPQGIQGIQGEKGDKGDQGDAGELWHLAAGDPLDGTGKDGDLALNITTSDYFEKTSGIWNLRGNFQGIKGDQGDVGPQGPMGPAGLTPEGEYTVAEINALDFSTIPVGAVYVLLDAGTITNGPTDVDVVADDWLGKADNGEWVNLGPLQGDVGPIGPQGEAATIMVGSTTTGAPGSNASVINSGDENDAVFNFTIPRGDVGATGQQGIQGDKGDAATVDAGTTTTLPPGSDATVVNSGDTSAAIFDFSIPQGVQGIQGVQGEQGIQGEKGDTGSTGLAATLNVGSTTTGPPQTNAIVTNSGDENDAVFDFVIPRGDIGAKGDTGDQGTAATINVGTVTSVPSGTPPTVVNSGDENAAIFDFELEAGVQGIQGEQGPQGADSTVPGPTGPTGDKGDGWTSGAYDAPSGIVIFESDDGLGFVTGDLRGAQGVQGPEGPKGDAGTGIYPQGDITVAEINAFTSDPTLGFMYTMIDAGTITYGATPVDVVAHDMVVWAQNGSFSNLGNLDVNTDWANITNIPTNVQNAFPNTGGQITGSINVTDKIKADNEFEVGIYTASGNSAVIFNDTTGTPTGLPGLIWNNVDAEFQLDPGTGTNYKLWHDGNVDPSEFMLADGSNPMTGDLIIHDSGGTQRVVFTRADGTVAGSVYHSDATNQVVLARYEPDGLTLQSQVVLGEKCPFITGPNGGEPIIEFDQDMVTKKYVDDLEPDLTGYATEVYVDDANAIQDSAIALNTAKVTGSDRVLKSGDIMTGNLKVPTINSQIPTTFLKIYNPADGILIQTDSDITVDNTMFSLSITGNGYSTGNIMGETFIEGYSYSTDTSIINIGGLQIGANYTIDVFHMDGMLTFWIGNQGLLDGYPTMKFVFTSQGNEVITSVTNAPMPTENITNLHTIVPDKVEMNLGNASTAGYVLSDNGNGVRSWIAPDTGPQGPPGADGLGWTGGSYDDTTGIVEFTSDDGLGFTTTDLRGSDGVDGAQGPEGPEGPQGPEGPTGPEGPKGEDSIVPGPTGPTGPQGPKGEDGTDGVDGAQGPQGPAGVNGTDGKTWYTSDVDPLPTDGVDGDLWMQTTTDHYWTNDSGTWVDQGSLIGPKGDDGVDGPQGPEGPAGDPGPAGPEGPTIVSSDAGNQTTLGSDNYIYTNGLVERAGDTMTGTLVFGDGISESNLEIRATDTEHARFRFRRQDATMGSQFVFHNVNEVLTMWVYDTDGSTPLTAFRIENNGNVSVDGLAPTAIDHLTRKDYVDTRDIDGGTW